MENLKEMVPVEMKQLTSIEYLQNTAKYLGFPESILQKITTEIANGNNKFTVSESINHPLPNKQSDTISYDLNFSKSKQDVDRYFLNSYNAALNSPLFDEKSSQMFYIEKGKGITAKESYNLLAGRFIFKNMQTKEKVNYNAFISLDFIGEKTAAGNMNFQKYGENYGYSVKEAIEKYPIKDLENQEYKDNLIKSLERGNLQKVGLTTGQILFMEMNPKYKNFSFFEANLKPVIIHPIGTEKKNEKIQSTTAIEPTSQKRGVSLKR